ncbi:SNF2 family N-terminal domain-containing protein [Paraphoma chrysanthemicola]|nr:SNF2 family N-terminal domain-containing protein [Paraphoma chrysanthemicola]
MNTVIRSRTPCESRELSSKRLRIDVGAEGAVYAFVEPPRVVLDASNHDGTITDSTVVCFGMERLGKPAGHMSEVLSRLVDDTELEYQLTLRREAIGPVQGKKLARRMLGYLSIIIYGPKYRFEDVGDFMTQCKCFLQDPSGCDRDVPYMNAQCLFSIHETPATTSSLSRTPEHSIEDFTQTFQDIFEGFETTDSLEETPTPASLRTSLQKHQREALTFLLRRERGRHPCENFIGLWAPLSTGRGFTNIVTNQYQDEPGPLWRGGLLADEMGLGKTLTMIALIASDHAQYLEQLSSKKHDHEADHVHRGQLSIFVHHGKNKLQLLPDTVLPNIVFTTYQTIAYEQRSGSAAPGSLSAYVWRRIILDEAHIVRNHRTSTARAIAALKSKTRWAISGTPVQNSLTDFLGLFKFLQFAPYNDPKTFDQDLSQLWRDKPVDEATAIFKTLLSCFMLRRTKRVLDLPPRTDKILKVSFDEREEEHYLCVAQPVADLLNQPRLKEPVALDVYLQATIGVRISLGEDMCTQCQDPVSLPSIDEGLGPKPTSNTYYSSCGRMYCAACTQLLQFRSASPCGCTNGSASCPLLPLASSIRTPLLTPTREIVVFSCWTTSLDMVEWGLAAESIRSVRIDGSVAPKNRAYAVNRLRSDPNIRVILLTISCGACG